MQKALVPALLLVFGSMVLGATVLRVPVADAAGSLASIFVANDKQHPLPVEEQNLDADGNIKVHEQGTADVNVTNDILSVDVTNGSLSVAPPTRVTGGGGFLYTGTCPATKVAPNTITASALQISWQGSSITGVRLRFGDSLVAEFGGPALTGDPSPLVLPLMRPVTFDTVECFALGEFDEVYVFWVGNEP